ncbi:hypothetical protein DYH09_29420 [bacterium CPR1]|nr:hypothetical protein [bacterium CPR1]
MLFGSHWLKNVFFPPFWKLRVQHLYRTLDILARHKEALETALFDARRDLFSVDERPEDNLRWAEMLEDLKALHGIKLNLNGKPFLLRTELKGLAHKAFEAVGVRPPARVQPWTDQ